MKPDKNTCLNCGKQIGSRAKYCSDKCRMAYARNPNKQDAEPEQITNPNTNKGEQNVPEQPTRTNDSLRSTLSKTDKTFYDRAMKDFGEPYYNFDWAEREAKCGYCGAKYKTMLRLNRYCSYQHYSQAIGR